jgi:hypothetical protein
MRMPTVVFQQHHNVLTGKTGTFCKFIIFLENMNVFQSWKAPGFGRKDSGSSSATETTQGGLSDSNGTNNVSSSSSSGEPPQKQYRVERFKAILSGENVDMAELKKLSWNGVPDQFRSMVWLLHLGYMPTNKIRRDSAMARKRKEYADSIPMFFNISDYDRTTQEGELLRQIRVDLPRTNPDMPFFQQTEIQLAMERILYIWSIRHPASGYVQGMNDLLTPLLLIAIQPHTAEGIQGVLRCDVATLHQQVLMHVEADAYWCLTKLMDDIQDHYTFSQPGVQRMIQRLEDLVHRLDAELHNHLETQGVNYMQFSFRW